MKLSQTAGLAVLAASPLAAALRTISDAAKQEKYTSGSVMEDIMSNKYVSPGRRTF